jgi:hypothetical protein
MAPVELFGSFVTTTADSSCYNPYASGLRGMMTLRVPSYRYFYHWSGHTPSSDGTSGAIVASRSLFIIIRTRLILVIGNPAINTLVETFLNTSSSVTNL